MQKLMSGPTQELCLAVLGVSLFVAFFVVKEWSFHKLPYNHWLNRLLNPHDPARRDGGGGGSWDSGSNDGGGCD